jgi:hypothetical protein
MTPATMTPMISMRPFLRRAPKPPRRSGPQRRPGAQTETGRTGSASSSAPQAVPRLARRPGDLRLRVFSGGTGD